MLKKEITYRNLDDVEVTETFYFNLSKAELLEMEVSQDGGLEHYLERISESNDNKMIFAEFKKLIMLVVGERNGSQFRKSDEISQAFVSSEAFSELIFGFMTDSESAAEFVKGIMPSELAAQVDEVLKKQAGQEQLKIETDPTSTAPKSIEEFEQKRTEWMKTNAGTEFPDHLKRYNLSAHEVNTMGNDELVDGLKVGKYRIA